MLKSSQRKITEEAKYIFRINPLFWQISSNPGVLQTKTGKTGGDQLHIMQKYNGYL